MFFRRSTFSLEELKKAITQAYPGIEQRLRTTFIQHDIVGDDSMPYDIVETLLRHFFLECGLDEYMREVTNSHGHLDHTLIAPYLFGTSMQDVSDSNRERMVSCEEMTTMAIVWLKVFSDVYKRDEAGVSTMCGGGLWYGGSTAKHDGEVIHTVVSENPLELQSQTAELDASVTIDDNNYATYVNSPEDEEQLAQKNVENYIQTLVNEAAANRQKGVKCFVYSSEMTANGACISAGAAVPQRRERTQGRRKTAAGCC
ncbi:hypothetical protein BaOVIS_022880 [Babesia ovis]|uniref:Uncharacterized protein n=1 Tax=Babesia ovis TaxID=5869 RepID=A0A9W5WVH8_BABOV|nr:hypothetical protein BaOVIS_022880 [Babesia ovis]